MYSYYNLIPKQTRKLICNEQCYDEENQPTNITNHMYVRRCYMCGQLGHKAYECEFFCGALAHSGLGFAYHARLLLL